MIRRHPSDRISVFAGFASFFGLAALTEGAVGYMDSGDAPVFGATSPQFFRALMQGRRLLRYERRRLQTEMAAMLDKFFGLGTFPASVKASLELIGRPGEGPTFVLPIRPLSAEQRAGALRAAMVAANFLRENATAA